MPTPYRWTYMGRRWCEGFHLIKPVANNAKDERGSARGPSASSVLFIPRGRINVRPRKLAKDLRNGHLGPFFEIGGAL